MRRRHRHRRSVVRRLRRSFRGVGVAFVLALVAAFVVLWTVLPAVERTFSALMGAPDASMIEELQRRARAR
jgi:hypothetical protein